MSSLLSRQPLMRGGAAGRPVAAKPALPLRLVKTNVVSPMKVRAADRSQFSLISCPIGTFAVAAWRCCDRADWPAPRGTLSPRVASLLPPRTIHVHCESTFQPSRCISNARVIPDCRHRCCLCLSRRRSCRSSRWRASRPWWHRPLPAAALPLSPRRRARSSATPRLPGRRLFLWA
eukprot:353716-Chlamydomonas_euryale.AAC.11